MKHELVAVGPHQFTLNAENPLFQELTQPNKLYSNPNTKANQPRLYDVSSISENPTLFKDVVRFLAHRYRTMGKKGPTHILAIENRGCILGAPLALELGVPFIPMRHERRSENSFVSEGEDKLPTAPLSVRNNSINANSRVVIVDDFIISGETMISALDCARIVGSTVVEAFAVCDMSESGGVEQIHSLEPYKKLNVLTLFRLRNSLDVLLCTYKKQFSARL